MRLPTSLLLLVSSLMLDRLPFVAAMTSERKVELREETRDLFNHGFDAYMHNAFPMGECTLPRHARVDTVAQVREEVELKCRRR
jgi:hypothetical protein